MHRNIYRRPIDVIQKAKVASILFKLNRGVDVSSDISEQSLEAEELKTDNIDEVDDSMCSGRGEMEVGEVAEAVEPDDSLCSDCGEMEVAKSAEQGTREAINNESGSRHVEHPMDSSDSYKSVTTHISKETHGKAERRIPQQRKVKAKTPWSDDEVAAVKAHLKHCFSMNKIPQKHEAQQCLAAAPLLRKRRTWKDIKYFVYNRLKRNRPL